MQGAARLSPMAAILAFFIWAPHEARGQHYASGSQLAKVSGLEVVVSDGLDDRDCLYNPNILKTEAELVLRRSGIAVDVDQYGLRNHTVEIIIGGYQLSDGTCVATYRVELWKFEALFDSSRGLVYSFVQSGVMTGPQSNFQDRLRSTVNEHATTLANEILKAREQ